MRSSWSASAAVAVALAALELTAAGCGRADYEVKVLGKDQRAPSGFLPLVYYELHGDGTCETADGLVAIRRPDRATSEARFCCYHHSDGRTLGVTLRLPDDAWARAGWTRCAAAEEETMREACRTAPAREGLRP
jgi:hypothetical protein